MRKNNINLRVLFIMLLSIVMINTQAQSGLNFQGVARTSNNVILASQNISIKLSILQGSSTGTLEYTETRKVTTNAQGLFTAVIGDTGAISTLGNFATINWKLTPKFLKIEMDPAAGTNFVTMGTTQFQYVAYAQYAKSVDAENIVGIVPVTLGGTGVSTIADLKTALTLNNVNNTADLTKPVSTLTQTALDLKLNATDTSKYTKKSYADSALLTKLSITGNAATAENITATSNTTLTSLLNLNTLGTITSGVWSGTVVAVEKGGTGATTASAARTSLGLVIGANVQAPLVAGTDYLAPTGSAVNLTNFPTFNQNTTGNAATATTAGNITATTNTTLTSLQNLVTVGTITSGVWSGTAVAVEKGGTGLATTGTAGQLLTSTGSGTLTWTTSTAAVFLPTVVIGNQQWMRENLDVLTYRNGDVIPQITTADWANATTGAWCWYLNDPAYGAIYGKLYNWYAVNDPRGLAPQGWHIPTDDEWTTLGALLGGDAAAGGKMKTTGTTRWTTPNTNATNESGFSGLPSSYRNNGGTFPGIGYDGNWWSATQSDATHAWFRYLENTNGNLARSEGFKKFGYSVRCIRD